MKMLPAHQLGRQIVSLFILDSAEAFFLAGKCHPLPALVGQAHGFGMMREP